MKNIIRVTPFILAGVFFVLHGAAFGQTIQERIKTVADAKKFVTQYDRFKDVTAISTYVRFRFPKGKVYALECSIRGEFTGTDINDDVKIFRLICSGYETASRLIFLLDGKRLDLRDGIVDRGNGSLLSKKWATFSINRDDLRDLAEAKDIEIQLGDFEGSIEKDGQPRIKTLYELTAKPK